MKLSTIRQVAFWSFTGLYFLIAPIITLHALGFVYDPALKSLVKTGIISIATEPKQARVFLNGRFHSNQTPTAISGLKPGHYHVLIEREGYQNWERELEVRREEVTRIEHILLIPKELKISHPVTFKIQSFLPSDDEKYLFLIFREQNKTVVLAYDPKKKKSFPVAELSTGAKTRFHSMELISSDDDKRVLIGFQKYTSTEYVVSLISEETQPIFLTDLIQTPISNVRFHPHDSEKLFYLSDARINSIDLQNRSKKVAVADNILSFEVINDKIYYFDSEQNLFSSDFDGKRKVDLLPNPGLKKLLFGENNSETYRVFMTEKSTMFWLSKNGRLIMNQLPYFVDESVRMLKMMGGSDQLIYWKSKELWLLDLQAVGKHESFFEEGPRKVLIWKSDRPIVSAQLLRDGHYAIVTTDRTIELVEINTLGEYLSRNWTIVQHWAGDEISTQLDEMSGKFYWTGCDEKTRYELCETDLLEPSLFPFSLRFRKPYRSPIQISLTSDI